MGKLLSSSLIPYIILPLMVISPLLQLNLPSHIARIFLVTTFLAPPLWITRYRAKNRSKIVQMILFIVVESFIILQYSMTRLPADLEPRATRYRIGVLEFATQYAEQGTIVFNRNPHSYFFQTPLLVHMVSLTCGISPDIRYLSYPIIFCYLTLLIALVGLYLLKITVKKADGIESTFLSSILAFSFVSSNTLIFHYIHYRSIGMLMTLLLLCYFFDKAYQYREGSILALLLVVGITLGSPTANISIILFFLLFSIIKRRESAMVYALIPLTYMIYAGYSYTLSLTKYATFAWKGFVEFYQIVLSGEPVREGSSAGRILPWERCQIVTQQDTYVASAAHLSLLILSLIVVLILTFLWTRERTKTKRYTKDALLRASVICLWFMLAIVSITYIGASVQPEVVYSDIRSLVMIFLITLLPFAFTSKELFTKIIANKVLLASVLMLLVLSSLGNVYKAYPKSTYDPINVVEDPRLGMLSDYYTGIFIRNYCREGTSITFDYKGREYLLSESMYYTTSHLSVSTLKDPTYSFIVFDLNGLRFNSLYTSQGAYLSAYDLSLTENLIYNTGNITVIGRK